MKKRVSQKVRVDPGVLGLGCLAAGGSFFMGTLAVGWIALDRLTRPQRRGDGKDEF